MPAVVADVTFDVDVVRKSRSSDVGERGLLRLYCVVQVQETRRMSEGHGQSLLREFRGVSPPISARVSRPFGGTRNKARA